MPPESSSSTQLKTLLVLTILTLASWGLFFLISRNAEVTQEAVLRESAPPEETEKPRSLVPGEVKKGPQTNLITNDEVGISIRYPDYFRYGTEESQTGGMIQIASYDLDRAYDQFPKGLKVEIVKEENQDNLSLLEFAARSTEGSGPSLSFKKVNFGNHRGYGRYVQENEISSLEVFLAKGNDVIVIYVIGDSAEYQKQFESLEQMFGSIEFL